MVDERAEEGAKIMKRIALIVLGMVLGFGAAITPDSILARCALWVADYHDSPEVPRAWASRGWRLWQYAADENASHPAYGATNIIDGISHCDRNLFAGDEAALYEFWGAIT